MESEYLYIKYKEINKGNENKTIEINLTSDFVFKNNILYNINRLNTKATTIAEYLDVINRANKRPNAR